MERAIVYGSRAEAEFDEMLWNSNGSLVPLGLYLVSLVVTVMVVFNLFEKYRVINKLCYLRNKYASDPSIKGTLIRQVNILIRNEQYVQVGLALLLAYPLMKLGLKLLVML